MKVLWFGYMEEIVCDRVLGDVKMFGSAGNGTCKSVLNMLKALNLSDGWTVVNEVTVIEA